jgi:hypothetical protein
MALETYKMVNKLDVPQVRTTRYGKKSFMFAAATLWNDLRTISELKTVSTTLKV